MLEILCCICVDANHYVQRPDKICSVVSGHYKKEQNYLIIAYYVNILIIPSGLKSEVLSRII